jgi:multicomponent Na+:H+ antiporter subunit F
MLDWMIAVILIAMGIIFIRLMRGDSIWIKLLALNLLAVLIAMLIITYAVKENLVLVMDIAIAYSIIGFLSLILLTKFIGGRNAE